MAKPGRSAWKPPRTELPLRCLRCAYEGDNFSEVRSVRKDGSIRVSYYSYCRSCVNVAARLRYVQKKDVILASARSRRRERRVLRESQRATGLQCQVCGVLRREHNMAKDPRNDNPICVVCEEPCVDFGWDLGGVMGALVEWEQHNAELRAMAREWKSDRPPRPDHPHRECERRAELLRKVVRYLRRTSPVSAPAPSSAGAAPAPLA